MTPLLTDLAFLIIVVSTTLLLAIGGATRAGASLGGVLFAGLFAMNFFEPVAKLIVDTTEAAGPMADYARFGCLVGLFAAALFLLVVVIRRIVPDSLEMPDSVEQFGRWGCGLIAGWLTASILLTAVHTYPGTRDFGGMLPPELSHRVGPLMKIAPDYRWLGFTQYVSERVFPQPGSPHIFDGRQQRIGTVSGRWASFPIRYAEWRESLSSRSAPGGE